MSGASVEPSVKERPIIFSDSMVRAILQGRKTQTRRVVKCTKPAHCPYGKPGDRLWVREAWSPDHKPFYPHHPIVYRADYPIDIEGGKTYSPEQKQWYPFRWRPSIHMRRQDARITLRVKNVRIQRLRDISENDAIAEGVKPVPVRRHGLQGLGYEGRPHPSAGATEAFFDLWDHLNESRGYPVSSNPFVWVVAFEKDQIQ